MMTWTDLKSISTPEPIKALPKDRRGYPIFYTARKNEDGSPDFESIDLSRWTQVVRERRCGVCGGKITGLVGFVGGPLCMRTRLFMDAPMHLGCAEYALKTCPYLAAPRMAPSMRDTDRARIMLETNDSPDRPEWFGLGVTTGYELIQRGAGLMLRAHTWITTERWKAGLRL